MKCRLFLVLLAAAIVPSTTAEAASRAHPAPRASCVQRGAVAVFDVTARHSARIAVGSRNRVRGGRVVGRQPSSFPRGTRRGVLRVRFTARSVSWRLGKRVARIARTGRACATPKKPKATRPVVAAAPATRAPATKRTTPAGSVAPTPVTSAPITPATSLSARVFAPTSFWNADIPSDVAFATTSVTAGSVTKPVNPTVAQELAAFAKRGDGSTNTWINYRDFTAPITVVPADAAPQPVRLCRSYPSNCVPSWAGALDRTLRGVGADGTYLGGGVPIPDGFTPPADSDAEAIIFQPDYVAPDGKRGRVWELWGMRRNPDFDASSPVSATNARWMAAWGGRLVGTNGQGTGVWSDCWWSGCGHQANAQSDPSAWGRPDSQAREKSWGATATSLSLLGTQVSLRECRAGVIDHAVGLEVPDARPGFWWPAQRGDGGNSALATTEGMRLTFPRGSAKPSGLTKLGSALWDAVDAHGFVIDDKTSSSLNIRVEPGCEKTSLWAGVAAYNQLRNFPWSQLRVIMPGTSAVPNPTS